MKKKVEFLGGVGNNANAVNYMEVAFPDVTLYSEIEIPGDENPDEYGYDFLKEEIIRQAKENNINPESLKFWWD